MLVLQRKRQERVILVVAPSDQSTTIIAELEEIRGNKARIGFEAPRTTMIHRKEVYDAIQREQSE